MTMWAPFPNYLGLPSNTVLDYPGPAAINALNSPYRYNPSFDGYYAHNTQTAPYLNYLLDVVNGTQNEAFQATRNIGNGFYPLSPWPQNNPSAPISMGWGSSGQYPGMLQSNPGFPMSQGWGQTSAWQQPGSFQFPGASQFYI